MWQTIRNKLHLEDGATAVEYGIMVALIAVVIVVAVLSLSDSLSGTFEDTATCLEGLTSETCPPNTDTSS